MDNPRETVPGSGEDRAQRSGLGHSLMPSAPRSSQTVRTSGQTRPVSIRPDGGHGDARRVRELLLALLRA